MFDLVLIRGSAGAIRHSKTYDTCHGGGGTEYPTQPTSSQHQQAANDHQHATAGPEHPTPCTRRGTSVSISCGVHGDFFSTPPKLVLHSAV